MAVWNFVCGVNLPPYFFTRAFAKFDCIAFDNNIKVIDLFFEQKSPAQIHRQGRQAYADSLKGRQCLEAESAVGLKGCGHFPDSSFISWEFL